MKPAVFLDRDGTINVEKGYLHKINDFEYEEGVLEALKNLQNVGFLLIIISNQSGIARGYYSEEDYKILNEWMLNDLANRGIRIAGSYYCPHHPQASVEKYKVFCDCRKPETGLFERAILEHRIDVNKSFAVGDKLRDLAICKKSDIQGILITDDDLSRQNEEAVTNHRNRIWTCKNLLEASRMILQKENFK